MCKASIWSISTCKAHRVQDRRHRTCWKSTVHIQETSNIDPQALPSTIFDLRLPFQKAKSLEKLDPGLFLSLMWRAAASVCVSV